MNNLADAAAAYCLSVINRCSNDSCNFVLYCIRQLVACLREEFDAVIFKRIVRSRNYYTGVSLNLTGQERNCRSSITPRRCALPPALQIPAAKALSSIVHCGVYLCR